MFLWCVCLLEYIRDFLVFVIFYLFVKVLLWVEEKEFWFDLCYNWFWKENISFYKIDEYLRMLWFVCMIII